MSSSKKDPLTDGMFPQDASQTEVSCASSPCFLHEVDQAYFSQSNQPSTSDPQIHDRSSDWASIRKWRKEMRSKLIERRLALNSQDREALSKRVDDALQKVLAAHKGRLVGFYWPFKGEYDPRRVLLSAQKQGIQLALPVVVEKGQPLLFREWWPGIQMTRGVWNIPIPAVGEAVLPDTLIAPLVGFDQQGFRLGYGGGYYDRTLAAMTEKAHVIGVGFELGRLPTIYPQPHDVQMNYIVTEK